MISASDIISVVTFGLFRVGSAGAAVTVTTDFDDSLIAANEEFLATFGETITYYPKVGASREIVAIVDREQIDNLDGAPYGHSPRLVISMSNNSDNGISSTEVNTGGDKVELAVRLGETAQQRRITEILNQDAAMLELKVR